MSFRQLVVPSQLCAVEEYRDANGKLYANHGGGSTSSLVSLQIQSEQQDLIDQLAAMDDDAETLKHHLQHQTEQQQQHGNMEEGFVGMTFQSSSSSSAAFGYSNSSYSSKFGAGGIVSSTFPLSSPPIGGVCFGNINEGEEEDRSNTTNKTERLGTGNSGADPEEPFHIADTAAAAAGHERRDKPVPALVLVNNKGDAIGTESGGHVENSGAQCQQGSSGCCRVICSSRQHISLGIKASDKLLPLQTTITPAGRKDVRPKETPENARSHDRAMEPSYSHGMSWSTEDFLYDKILGEGVSAVCVSAIERRSGLAVAVKMLSKAMIVRNRQEMHIQHELELQAHLHHPHIVPVLTWFHNSHSVCIVLRFCDGGDLFGYLHRTNLNVDETATSRMMFDVLYAIRYCHSRKIAHLDIKPENILIRDGRLCLGDFGMSERIQSYSHGVPKARGTHDYWPPEQATEDDRFGKFNYKGDIWSCGVLAYEILLKRPPFGSTLSDFTKEQIPANIVGDDWDLRLTPEERARMSPLVIDFLSTCLQKMAANRPTAEELFDHEFIRKYNKDRLLEQRFLSDPYKRGEGFNDKTAERECS
eukprot:GHVS01041965.1.p1 GENE.GHVS01041965.1~~GHVS01041965.1.p1  ORF type:complete len:588 (-),score=111.55 GHVS01041965.1:246-2009(-)